MRSQFLLALAMICCIISCQKEPDDSAFNDTTCKIDQIVFYGDAPDVDTVQFTYTGDRVTRVDYPDYYIVPDYTNDLISQKNFYLQGSSTLAGYDEFSYNPDGTISRVVTHIVVQGLPVPYPAYENVFTWSGNKLTRLELNIDTSGTGMSPIVIYEYDYTGNNITEVRENDLEFQSTSTIRYTHDGNPNFYAKNPQLWLTDLLFADFNGFSLPFALSVNNVVSFYEDPANTTNVTYEATDKEDIKSIKFDGELVNRYNYKCQ